MSILVIAATFGILLAGRAAVSSVYAEPAIGKGHLCKDSVEKGTCRPGKQTPGQSKKEDPPV